MWSVSNVPLEKEEEFKIFSNSFYSVYQYNSKVLLYPIGDGILLLEGNIHRRGSKNSQLDDLQGIFTDYCDRGDNFIKEYKGNFILILILAEKLYVFGSRFGILKYYYNYQNGRIIVSNHINGIKKATRIIPSKLGMVIFSLTYHFTGGRTFFENIFHNQPGEYFMFNGNKLEIKQYWKPATLLCLHGMSADIQQITESLRDIIRATLKPDIPVSLSLTGGADTRNLLALFLSMGIKPHLYTYGDPESSDCLKAKKIAQELNLDHELYDIHFDVNTFEEYARKIISLNGGMTSIHRSHRVLSVEKERKNASSMYLGTLGGEFIKGITEDNYIVPSIVYENYTRSKMLPEDLQKYLSAKRLIVNRELQDEFLLFLNSEPYMQGSVPERKINALAYITAHLHDAQDLNIYSTIFDEVHTPFLDIDYLELIFSTNNTFNFKESKCKFLRKLENPYYSSLFLKDTYPLLLQFEYSGEHKPSEVLFNKYYAALMKIYRKKINPYYPPNFPLGTWMENFVKKHLTLCADYEAIFSIFDINGLLDDLKTNNHKIKESYWLKYTNPIMMRFLIEEFVQ